MPKSLAFLPALVAFHSSYLSGVCLRFNSPLSDELSGRLIFLAAAAMIR